MAIPGVESTESLLSLDPNSEGSIGALIGLGAQKARDFRSSLAGQLAPIYGKGGFQYETLAPFNQLFNLSDEDEDESAVE